MRRFIFAFLILFSSFYVSSVWAENISASKFIEESIALENPNVRYDGRYRKINYPMGDVPPDVGVCTDVVIRAYRTVGVDLQELAHEDMKNNFNAYPKLWGLTRPDKNIDHRRVPNLKTFFNRHGKVLKNSDDPNDYESGDIVTWNLTRRGSLPHIGIVTNKYSSGQKRPLIMHNIGNGQVLEDMLFDYKITGHYRYGLD